MFNARSRVRQIETLLNTLNAHIHSIKAVRHVGVLIFKLIFKAAKRLFHLANIVPHVIDRAADVAQMLKNDVVRPSHDVRLSQHRIVVNAASMFFPKTDVKNDPVRRWHRSDRQFFANGACQVLAHAFLERYPDLGFCARWIKPVDRFRGNHIYVTDGINAFDYHGLTTEQRLLAFGFKRGRRFFPGWKATLVDLPTDVLISEQRSRQFEGLWLREPKQFLHDAMPRARAFLDRFGDLRTRLLTASASCTSPDAE